MSKLESLTRRCQITAHQRRVIRLAVVLSLLMATASAAELSVVVVDSDGKPMVDAVVALLPVAADSSEGGTKRPDSAIDQINKRFRPSVLAIQTGTLVYLPNSDNIHHEVYSFSEAKRFETKLYSGKAAPPVLFDKAGVVVLGCNIHDSMSAYVYVLDTPYFAKTDGTGSANVSAPTARYTLQIWHPQYQKGHDPHSEVLTITKSQESVYRTLPIDRPSSVSAPLGSAKSP